MDQSITIYNAKTSGLVVNAPNPSCCSNPDVMCENCYNAAKSQGLQSLKRSTLKPTHTTRNKLEPLLVPTLNFGQESPPKSKPGEPLLLPRMDWTQKG